MPLHKSVEPLRKRKIQRYGALKTERSSWLPRYRQLSDFILPFSGRFLSTDRNIGTKSFNSIYDSTGTRAHSILSAGLMAGMTSPARPWFRLATPDNDLMEHAPVKMWLEKVSQLMRDVFRKSNTYRALHTQYDELGCFATAVNLIDDDFETVIWNHVLTAGEYCIAADHKGRPNTMYREFDATVAQIVEKFIYDADEDEFHWDRGSIQLKNAWDQGNFDTWRPILHCIEPRLLADREPGKRDAANKPWASCYFEMGGDEERTLRESGYDEFPGEISRWHTRGGDVYGNGPSFVALPDIKQLQRQQFDKGQAIAFMAKPPIELPPEAKGSEVEYLPGGVTIGSGGQQARARNLVDVRIDLQHLAADMVEVRQRIMESFFAPLFLMITEMKGIQPRNQWEIAERHEEKLLMLGPVLERLHDEILTRHIDITFAKMVETGMLRNIPPPPELEGMDLKVEFVSTLAQAQKAIGLGSLDRLIGTVGLIAQGSADMSVWDKIDKDQMVDKYSDMLSTDPSVIVSDEKIVVIRESRKQEMMQQQLAAQAKPMADAAKATKDMGDTNVEGAKDVMQSLMGYTT